MRGAPVTYNEARFRWAVCQIDSLQRLKYERRIIQKALKNLPKTLHETYDRIFLAVPEEERRFVEYALRWIAHHNELHGRGMPYEVLIQATEATMLSLTGSQTERFYDKDTLREVCGCLIDISPEDLVDHWGKCDHTYISVSFAHYSVHEYLDSTRAANAVFDYQKIDEEDLKDHFLELTLSEPQLIGSDGLLKLESNLADDSDVIRAVDSRFNIYCVVSALVSLYMFPNQICRNSTLNALAIDLLDPSKPHFSTMKAVAFSIDHSTPLSATLDDMRGKCFWTVEWHPDTSAELEHLYNLLLLTESCREYLPLAKKFLQEKDMRSLLLAQLCFNRELLDISDYDAGIYDFMGSIVEVFAQLAVKSATAFEFLVEVGGGSFDPSVALMLYIGAHDHSNQSDCNGFCPLQRLLELGADPNARGYLITPLQIATFCSDYEGVKMLLGAGAMPNDTGSADGVIWREDSVMHDLNHFHGASPLLICRDLAVVSRPLARNLDLNARKKMEALLLHHGAEALSTISSLDTQESRTMTGGSRTITEG